MDLEEIAAYNYAAQRTVTDSILPFLEQQVDEEVLDEQGLKGCTS